MLWSERFQLEPLGDQAVLASFASEAGAFRFASAVRAIDLPWRVDVVLSYVTVAVFFDLSEITYDQAAAQLRALRIPRSVSAGRLHTIPCCYERQLDLPRVMQQTGLPAEEVIRLHTDTEFTIYAIGFSPGFPYLGYLPQPLCGVTRLESPRISVEPGSVGITGRQTGIYPLATPGGWNLIGQTPLQLVHIEDGYFPLRAGDRVRFRRIDEMEYTQLEGQRLSTASSSLQ